jgi:hypothetical protein
MEDGGKRERRTVAAIYPASLEGVKKQPEP